MDYGPWTNNYRLNKMATILYNISQVLGITIIHSLWQGLFIYFMLKIALGFSGKLSAQARYTFALTGVMAITAWFVYTLISEISLYNWLAVAPVKFTATPLIANLPNGIQQYNLADPRYYYTIEGYFPYITALYVAGLLFNGVSLVIARKRINTIRQTMSIDVALQQQVKKFTVMLGIHQNVRIGLSKLVSGPCMMGYFKPVILLPFTLSTSLSAEEIEVIVLHELAHIKRNDYLVNIIQQLISIMLFFNPCVRLINRIINEERENCCDDLVVQTTANPLLYAKTLLKLEQTRQNDRKLALAATGKKHLLLTRVKRIMETKTTTPGLRPALMASVIFTAVAGCIALLKPEIAQGKISVKNIDPIANVVLADTSHKTTAAHPAKKPSQTATTAHKKSVSYSEESINTKLNELSAEVQKHSDALGKFYNSEDFKRTESQMQELSLEMQGLYNNPALKNQQEELQKASADFSKNWGETSEQKSIAIQMAELGKSLEAYFKTPELKRLDAELRKKYDIPERHEFNGEITENENYNKYQAELESRMRPDMRAKMQKLKSLGEQMSARYNSPEFKAQNARLQALGDSIGKSYGSPAIKEKQEQMEKLGKEMQAYQNNPELKNEQALLNAAVAKLNAFLASPKYKAYMEHIKKLAFNYHFEYNDGN